MAPLLRHARKRLVDEEHDDELRYDAMIARRLQRRREHQHLDRDVAEQLVTGSLHRSILDPETLTR